MYKIGVIGPWDSVSGFKAVGLTAFPVRDSEEAKEILDRIINDNYGILYIVEGLYKDMTQEIEKYKDMRIPAIIPIPGMDGSYGIGRANLKKAVERAVGADILFQNDSEEEGR
ncbi:MAG: V-type ATP synthase subunit F [Eubacteriales bacterium]|nr:V-type ATP synthase subunit F [Eubacteriales bacterium]MDD4582846.1 V-type ATP synthase subunit F [Eubacteriales bacterium]